MSAVAWGMPATPAAAGTVSSSPDVGDLSVSQPGIDLTATGRVEPLSLRSSMSKMDESSTLVLYDPSGEWNHVGQLYARKLANLSSRFGGWEIKPITDYQAGDMQSFESVIYAGSNVNEVLPEGFLDDVLQGHRPVLWLGANIDKLHHRASVDDIPGYFIHQYGWQYRAYDYSEVPTVVYEGRQLTRDVRNGTGIIDVIVDDPARVEVKAEAIREDGTSFPWAVHSDGLTYVGEVPLSYISETDRYLGLADLMFDVLAPATPERHRGLVRLEDVSPLNDPHQLRAFADMFAARGIPFSVGVIPVYVDPNGGGPGIETRVHLSDKPELVEALRYMESKGGTLIQHGYTHQYANVANPYNGITGDDFEFFSTHVDEQDFVIYDGPLPEDSEAWARERMELGSKEFRKSGLASPGIFEFPHYAASDNSYAAAADMFDARYERALYFTGPSAENSPHFAGQFFPYEVTDIHGSRVIPENLGNIQLVGYNNHAPILPQDIIDRAAANLVVRDGFASFFFHTFYSPDMLAGILDDIEELGYDFVSPADVLQGFPHNTPPPLPQPRLASVSSVGRGIDVNIDPTSVPAGLRQLTWQASVDGGATWSIVRPDKNYSFQIRGLEPNRKHDVQVRMMGATGVGPATPAVGVITDYQVPTGDVFVPSEPARVFDSRFSQEKIPAGGQRVISVADSYDVFSGELAKQDIVPAGATAVAYNVTVVQPEATTGWMAVMPGDQTVVAASTINWAERGEVIANGAIAKLADDRTLRIHNGSGAASHVVVDIVGYFYTPTTEEGALYHESTPVRVHDSRTTEGGPGPVAPGIEQARVIDLSSAIPEGATAAAINMTVVNPQSGGWLSAQPGDATAVTGSTLNWKDPGDIIANSQFVQVDDQRRIKIVASTQADVIIDVTGAFTPTSRTPDGAAFHPLDPYRAYDSRYGQNVDGTIRQHGPLGHQGQGTENSRRVFIGDRYRVGGSEQDRKDVIPSDAQAVAYNVVAVNQQSRGWLAVTSGAVSKAPISTINWTRNPQVIANGAVTGVSQRAVNISNGSNGQTDVIIDVNGYFR